MKIDYYSEVLHSINLTSILLRTCIAMCCGLFMYFKTKKFCCHLHHRPAGLFDHRAFNLLDKSAYLLHLYVSNKIVLKSTHFNLLSDVNECTSSTKLNGGCADICVNEPGSYHCECNAGYNLVQRGANKPTQCAGKYTMILYSI